MIFRLKQEQFNNLSKEELLAGIMSSSAVAICDSLVAATTDIVLTILKENMAGMFEELLEDFDAQVFMDNFEDAIIRRAQRDMTEELGTILAHIKDTGEFN